MDGAPEISQLPGLPECHLEGRRTQGWQRPTSQGSTHPFCEMDTTEGEGCWEAVQPGSILLPATPWSDRHRDGPTESSTGMDPHTAAQGWTHRQQHRDGPTQSSSGMDPQRAAQVPPLLLPAGEGSHLPLKGGGLSLCLSPGSSPAFCSSPRRRNADIADLMVCFTVLMLLSNCCWELLIH